MRFVSVRELRGKSAEIWRGLAKESEMVITLNGKPIAILAATSEKTFERSLAELRRSRAVAAVDAMQLASRARGFDKMSLRDVNAEIKAARRALRLK